MPRNPGAPSVFISSTPDLKEYRKAAERAASRARLPPSHDRGLPRRRPPAPRRLPRQSHRSRRAGSHCRQLLRRLRLRDQPANEFKSYKWIECEEAARQGKEVFSVEWPRDQREAYRITAAIKGSREVRFALLGILCDVLLLHLRSRYNDPQNTGQEGQSADGDSNCG